MASFLVLAAANSGVEIGISSGHFFLRGNLSSSPAIEVVRVSAKHMKAIRATRNLNTGLDILTFLPQPKLVLQGVFNHFTNPGFREESAAVLSVQGSDCSPPTSETVHKPSIKVLFTDTFW